jgi:hypothetical protein
MFIYKCVDEKGNEKETSKGGKNFGGLVTGRESESYRKISVNLPNFSRISRKSE